MFFADDQEANKRFKTFAVLILFFHSSEFVITFCYNRKLLSSQSFLFSRAYSLAMLFAICEFTLMSKKYREFESSSKIKFLEIAYVLGTTLCVFGETVRKTAEIQAKQNFTHKIQTEKRDEHELVRTGIYRVCRHPGYLGWLIWAPSTQLVLGNPVSFVAFACASWMFFKKRIPAEEYFLCKMFGDEVYGKYRMQTRTWIPFIR